jgi:hypothetical protein
MLLYYDRVQECVDMVQGATQKILFKVYTHDNSDLKHNLWWQLQFIYLIQIRILVGKMWLLPVSYLIAPD